MSSEQEKVTIRVHPETNQEGVRELTPQLLADMVKHGSVSQLRDIGGPDALGRALGCYDLTKGLDPSTTDFAAIKQKYGKNELDPPHVPSYLSLVWDGLHDLTICMLIAAAIVSLVLALAFEEDKSTAWIEGVAILVAVTFVVNFQAWTDYNNARTFRRQQLELENQREIHIVRGGDTITIHPRELVVGDVLRIGVGNILPADGLLLEGRGIKMDEAALTGESKVIEKQVYNESNAKFSPFLLSGTSVMNGQGRMLVLAVGVNSMQGQILAQVSEQNRKDEKVSHNDSAIIGSVQAGSVPDIEDRVAPLPSDSIAVRNTRLSSLGGDQRMRSISRVSSTSSAVQLPPVDPVIQGLESHMTLRGHESHIEKKKARRVRRFLANLISFNRIDDGGTLMEKLDRLALDVGKIGFFVAAIVFIVMCVRWSISEFQDRIDCIEFDGNFTGCMLNANQGCSVAADNVTCKREWNGVTDATRLLQFFIISVTILVVVVPEGLPLAVTLSLSLAMRRMAVDNNQVKNMESSETMGSATTICSDKTGTLTENRMTCVRVTFGAGHEDYKAGPGGSPSLGQVAASAVPSAIITVYAEGCALASEKTSRVDIDEDGKFVYAGNATECGLLRLVHEMGANPDAIRADPRFAPDTGSSLDWGVRVFPFSSSRKRMSVVVRYNGGYRIYSKGAPQYILDSCSSVIDVTTGNSVPLDSETRKKLDGRVEQYAHEAMRTMAVAYRDFPIAPPEGWDYASDETGSSRSLRTDGSEEIDENRPRACESKLTLLGIVGIEDPLRPSVIEAIKDCNKSGVDVRMCTGDALETAIAISFQSGILKERDMEIGPDGRKYPKEFFAMTGAEFDERVHDRDRKKPLVLRRAYDFQTKQFGEMRAFPFKVDKNGKKILNQKKFDEIWPKLRVLARCLPEDKLTLVRGIRRSKVFADSVYCAKLEREFGIKIFPDYQVVAVTGDGTNDAPALKEADVGFAMGIVGTDIAKQACDIILMDDNFASIVKAVKWGRNVFDSISKFVSFQLTVNLVAIVIATVGSFVFARSPLGAVQMLWVNLIMDSFASFALATDPPSPELLDRAPYGKRRPMISRVMAFNIFGQAIYQLAILFAILFDSSWIPDENWQTGNVEKFPPPSSHPGSHVEQGTLVSVHWTIVFNTFVLMQLVNELNSRKLQTVDRLRMTWQEWNVFRGIHRNPYFIVIVLGTFIVQIIIVQFAGPSFTVAPLAISQWIFCTFLGIGCLVWQFVINAVLVLTDPYFTGKDDLHLESARRKTLNEDATVDAINIRVNTDE